MAKKTKKEEEPLSIKGSFADVIKVAIGGADKLEKNTAKITWTFNNGHQPKTEVLTADKILDDHLMTFHKSVKSYTMEIRTDAGELIKIVVANGKITATIVK